MALVYVNHRGDDLYVVTEHSELGTGDGKTGDSWALRAFGAICENKVDLRHPYTLWHFRKESHIAVVRILRERRRNVMLLGRAVFYAVISQLQPAPDDRPEEGEEPGPERGRLIAFPGAGR